MLLSLGKRECVPGILPDVIREIQGIRVGPMYIRTDKNSSSGTRMVDS